MFCRNCGQSLPDGAIFCKYCGTKTSKVNQTDSNTAAAVVAQPAAVVQPAALLSPPIAAKPIPIVQPVIVQPVNVIPQVQVQPVNYQRVPAVSPVIPKKKKRRVALWISLSILLVILLGAGYLIASLFGVFGPKDLGVKYTEKDYESALTKIGTQITFDGMTGDELRDYNKDLQKSGEELAVSDYTWEFSDYQEKTIELTPEEATALLNEIAPGFFWFEDQQVKVLQNGSVEASGTLLAQKAIDELYPDLKDQIPISIPEKLDLYAIGGISIEENELTLDAKEFKSGIISPVSVQTLNDYASYFETLYTSVPGLIIHSLEVNDDGNFVISALIPQTATITV